MELQILILIVGVCLGSFLNVCIYRIPRKGSVVQGKSRCTSCRRALLWQHKIPVVSYLLLKRRCFWCHEKISRQYPLVEVLTGFILLMFYSKYGPSTEFLIYSSLTMFLIVIAGIDVKTLLIPNVLIIFGIGLWLVFTIFFNSNLINGLVGGIFGGGMLLLIALLGKMMFKKASMGGGDVKLTALIGLFLGTEGILYTLGWAVMLGGVLGAIGLLSGYLNRNSKLPFALFLAIGALIYLILDPDILMVITIDNR